MFSMFRALWRGIRILVWAPFAVAANPGFWIVLNGAFYAKFGDINPFALFFSLMMCGLSIPVEHTLRPAPRRPTLQPPSEKPIPHSLTRLAVKAKGRGPSVARTARNLTPGLRALLANPVTTSPEAILHDRQLLEAAAQPPIAKAA